MNILILANLNDLQKKMSNEVMLDYMIEQFSKEHNIKIFSKYDEVRKQVPKEILLPNKSLKDTLENYKKDKKSFMVITRLAVSNIDYGKFKIYHDNHDKKCSIVLRNLVKGKTTPIYKLDDKKIIIDINRKRYASCGIYMFDSTVDFSNLKTLASKLNDLIDEGEVKAFIHAGYYERNSGNLKGIEYRTKEVNGNGSTS